MKRIEPKNGLGHKRIKQSGHPVYMPCFLDSQQVGYVVIRGIGKYDCYNNDGLCHGTRFQIVDARDLIQKKYTA